MEKNRVEVVIDGQIITLVSDEREEYMQSVALYIDKKLGEIRSSKSNNPVNEHLRTLLISVNIADDYFKAVEQRKELEETHRAYINEMGRMQEENQLLAEKLHELQAQISYVREQYIREVGQMQEENEKLKKTSENSDAPAEDELRKEVSRLADANRDLQEQLQYTRHELEEYISTFDDRQNVVNFSPKTGR